MQTITLNNARSALYYKVDSQTQDALTLALQSNYNAKEIKSTISKRVLQHSKIIEYTANEQLNTKATPIILKKIYTLSFFQRLDSTQTHYYENIVMFTFECKDTQLHDTAATTFLHQCLQNFLQADPAYHHIMQKFSQGAILGSYFYDKRTNFHTEDATIHKIINTPDLFVFQEGINTFQHKKSLFYFEKNNLLEITTERLDKHYEKRMTSYALALAYKSFFNRLIILHRHPYNSLKRWMQIQSKNTTPNS